MFETYGKLIEAAAFKGPIEFVEKKAVKIFYNSDEVALPNINQVVLPGEYTKVFMGMWYLEYSKMFEFMIKYPEIENLPDSYGKEFYCWSLFHGQDHSHHGEPFYTGLLIESEYLEKRSEERILEAHYLFPLLKELEDLKAPQCGHHTELAAALNEDLTLEQKIVPIELYKIPEEARRLRKIESIRREN